MAIMGLSPFRVTQGTIWFEGEDVTHLPIDERARRGIAMIFQRPPTVHGVALAQLAAICVDQRRGSSGSDDARWIGDLASQLQCTSLLPRDVNDGFSGGEIKKAELLQVLGQQPSLALIDDPDAGVDLDNIELVGQTLARLLSNPSPDGHQPGGLIITHTGHILKYVQADVGHVLYGGTLVAQADEQRLLHEIRKHGYGNCPLCQPRESIA